MREIEKDANAIDARHKQLESRLNSPITLLYRSSILHLFTDSQKRRTKRRANLMVVYFLKLMLILRKRTLPKLTGNDLKMLVSKQRKSGNRSRTRSMLT